MVGISVCDRPGGGRSFRVAVGDTSTGYLGLFPTFEAAVAALEQAGGEIRRRSVSPPAPPPKRRIMTCSDAGPLPCHAVPTAACFGQPPEWRFSVSEADANWRRTLRAHEKAHIENFSSRRDLIAQAALMTQVAKNKWKCGACGGEVDKLPPALSHRCPGPAPPPPRVPAATSSQARRLSTDLRAPVNELHRSRSGAAATSVFPDVLRGRFDDLAEAFQRARADVKVRPHVASAIHLAVQAPTPAADTLVGTCFPWHGEKNALAYVLSERPGGRVEATMFMRRPQDARKACALHPGGGGCWRPCLPLSSGTVVPPPERAQVRMLVPRPGRAKGVVRSHQRCFQVFRGGAESGGADGGGLEQALGR